MTSGDSQEGNSGEGEEACQRSRSDFHLYLTGDYMGSMWKQWKCAIKIWELPCLGLRFLTCKYTLLLSLQCRKGLAQGW